MGALYKNYRAGNVKNATPGYAPNAWITPVSYLDSIKEPVLSATPLLGEKKTIGQSHTYLDGKGSIAVYAVPKTVEGDGEMVGEILGKRFRWTPKIIVAGDSPELLEMVENLINESFLLHVQEPCNGGSTQLVQFGSKCTPAVVNAVTFKSGTQSDGRKQFEFEMEAFDKYFYNGSLVDMADVTLEVSAGADQTFSAASQNATLLSGTATGHTSVTWSKVSGPSGSTIQSANALSTMVTGLVQGSYVFRLTATDGTNTVTDEVTLTVNA